MPKPPDKSAAPAPATEHPMLGRVLSDRYRVDELVARGAFGAVYRGVHLHMRKEVAIKVLHPEIEHFPELVERFEREAIAGAHVRHTNVAAATDIGKFDKGSYFLVQEYVRGETLRDLMDRGPLPVARAGRIARQVALALGAAHRHGIVHRDVKPTNVMLVEGTEDFAKLIDFGLARVPVRSLPNAPEDMPHPEWKVSEAGVVFGTVKYMAPEAALGMSNVTELSDLYALGVILFEMLTGKHPYDDTLPAGELFDLQRHAPIPTLAERNPDVTVPDALESVLRVMLAKDPEERYPDAAELVGALDAALEDEPDYAVVNNPDSVRPSRFSKEPSGSLRGTVSAEPSRQQRPTARSRQIGAALIGAGLLGALLMTTLGSYEPPPEDLAHLAMPPPFASFVKPKESFEVRYRRELKAELLKLAKQGDALQAADTLQAMIKLDTKLLAEEPIQTAAAKMLAALPTKHEKTDKLFFDLSKRAGAEGLDLLYRVLEEDPDSVAGRRSKAILGWAAVTERASPALRVTWEVRRAACSRKRTLFERAGNEGDARTLIQLKPLQKRRCSRGECCYGRNIELDRAVASLAERSAAQSQRP